MVLVHVSQQQMSLRHICEALIWEVEQSLHRRWIHHFHPRLIPHRLLVAAVQVALVQRPLHSVRRLLALVPLDLA